MSFRSSLRVVEFQVIVLSAIGQLLLATFKTSNTQAITLEAPVEYIQPGLNLCCFTCTKMVELGCFSIITIAHSLATSELKGASTAYASEVLLVHHDELSQ